MTYGGGGGTSVYEVTGIPLFYDWVPYHYGILKYLIVGLQLVLDVGPPPPSERYPDNS